MGSAQHFEPVVGDGVKVAKILPYENLQPLALNALPSELRDHVLGVFLPQQRDEIVDAAVPTCAATQFNTATPKTDKEQGREGYLEF